MRPTPDRVRETLFNWLSPRLPGARCLDLFAGTGALGLEALSRGAELVWFVEKDPRLIKSLRAHGSKLQAELRMQLVQADAQHWLSATEPIPFDVVFVDPPYSTPLAASLTMLANGWLAAGARVYVERGRAEELEELTDHGELKRSSRAGQVYFGLLAPDSPSR